MAEDSEKYGGSDGPPRNFRPILCFTRRIPLDVDLMMFEVDDHVFCGRLKIIVELSRAMLSGLSGRDVHNLLMVGDTAISIMVMNGFQVTNEHGEQYPLSQELLNCVDPIDMLGLVAGCYDDFHVVVRDHEGEGKSQVDLTASRLCAAFALGQAFSAIVYGTRPESIASNAHHAMQAAEACAMARLLSGEETHLAPLVGKRHLGEQVRKAAAARLVIDSDGKQAAKAQALELWQEWQAGRAKYKSGADFARQVVKSLTAIESTKTVERWMVKWRAEAKNRH